MLCVYETSKSVEVSFQSPYGKALISPPAIASLLRNIQNNVSHGNIRIKSGFVSENEHEILKKQKSLCDETQKGSEV